MRGYTLFEIVSVLALLAVGVSTTLPTIRKLADRAAVLAAREDVVAVLLEARTSALSTGGASLVVFAQPPRFRVETDGRVLRSGVLGGDGIVFAFVPPRDSAVIRFDRLGLGRFANRTIRVHWGDATASVVVSSYGRVRRR